MKRHTKRSFESSRSRFPGFCFWYWLRRGGPRLRDGWLQPARACALAPGLAVFIADAQPQGLPVVYFPSAYAGTAPDQPCGLEQLNFAVPNDVSPGVYEFYPWSVMIRPGGDELVVPGSVGATISVK